MPQSDSRPYKDKTIAELVHLFNDKCLAAKRLGNVGACTTFENEDLPSTFLQNPASDEEIEALDRKIRGAPYNFSEGLPADYVEFLKITNGIYADNRDADADEIFRPVSKAEVQEGWLQTELLPWQLMDPYVSPNIDWPEMEWCIQLGAGGDEGIHVIVPPTSIEKAIEVLDQAYENADKPAKKAMEEAAKRLYGSLSNLRQTKCMIMRNYHWAAEFEAFSSFKHLLENFVQSMDEGYYEDRNESAKGSDHDDDSSAPDAEPTNKRKKVPDGKADSLKGLKLIFTGTFNSMDRNTCKATVKKHGGETISKLEDSDYIVLGVNPGPKKIEVIKSNNLTTIDEEGFFQLLQGNEPRETQGDLKNEDTNSLPAKKSGSARKELPQGKANVLKGLKILFTGTMETMDRATAKKTAEKYGAKVITKLEETDYVVLGTNAGPKKIEEIEKKGLKTISEREFLDMLQDDTTSADAGEGDVLRKTSATSEMRGTGQAAQTGTRHSKRTRKA